MFVVNTTVTTYIYTYGHTLSLHDALPISDDVGYDIARQDTGSGKGDGARAGHEFEVADRDRLPPHDAGHGQPFDRADRGEDQEDIIPEHRHQHDDEEQQRNRIENVDETHHQHIDGAAEPDRGGAPGNADEQRDHDGDQADRPQSHPAIQAPHNPGAAV